MVPWGYSVELFSNDVFVAPSMVVNGDVFEDSHLQMRCTNVTGDFKDKTSSLKVYKNTVLGASVGRW